MQILLVVYWLLGKSRPDTPRSRPFGRLLRSRGIFPWCASGRGMRDLDGGGGPVGCWGAFEEFQALDTKPGADAVGLALVIGRSLAQRKGRVGSNPTLGSRRKRAPWTLAWSRGSDSNRRVLADPDYKSGAVNHCATPAAKCG